MRLEIVLAGGLFACGALLSTAAAQAASQTPISVAENEKSRDQHAQDNRSQDQPKGGQGQTSGRQNNTMMSVRPNNNNSSKTSNGNSNVMTGHPSYKMMSVPPSNNDSSTTSGHPSYKMMKAPRDHTTTTNSTTTNSTNSMMMNGHVNPQVGRGTTHRNFDRHSFQRNFTAPRQYRAAAYVRPHGWYSHHWVFGEILPALFWTQSYWISDYYDYGLADPPPGFVWVRDGDDALLVDQGSGEILEVEYDVFD